MGSSSSYSSSNTTNTTSTSTNTVANAFNNALNTTQNFSNIGGVPAQGGDTFGSINYTVIIAGVIGLIAFFILFKR